MCAPLAVQILSISCSFLGKNWQNSFSHPPLELAPSPRGNPGSTTERKEVVAKNADFYVVGNLRQTRIGSHVIF